MFGISDPLILICYLLSFGCVVFAVWFGIAQWNKDSDGDKNNNNKQL
ncbi:MAG: hypothetical protein LBJ60_00905 [Tannerellaceae bacterium]|jgi:hypothetical protein|nr:hypothetical protein [Tannerellaceae bacterium]